MSAVIYHCPFCAEENLRPVEEPRGAWHCIACANGTDALLLPLYASGIGPGDAVFVPSFTFAATAEVVALAKAEPVFVDIDPESMNIDPHKIEAAITPQTTAIMPVHCYGRPCDVDAIQRIADTLIGWKEEEKLSRIVDHAEQRREALDRLAAAKAG